MFVLTGQSANLDETKKLTVSNGSFSISGQSVDLKKTLVLSLDTDDRITEDLNTRITESGDRRVTSGGVGSFVLTGQSASIGLSKEITASNGSFTLTGQIVLFVVPSEASRADDGANDIVIVDGAAQAMVDASPNSVVIFGSESMAVVNVDHNDIIIHDDIVFANAA